MAFEIDLGKLENDYSIMSAEEFALLRRDDLTPEAGEIYDRVAAIRRTTAGDSALEVPPLSSDTPRPNTVLMREATGSETFEHIVKWAYSTLPQSIKSTAATAYPPQPCKLPAPLWHTGILLLSVLVPFAWWPGGIRLLRALPYNSASFDILRGCDFFRIFSRFCLRS